MKFVYVMSEADREKLISMGYAQLKEDPRNHVWVFQAKDTLSFAEENEIDRAGIQYVLSDVLTF